MNFGPLEHDIRRVPGVLALQFTPTEVFVLVEPSADVAQVTAAVEGLLAVAAEARRVSVIGGTSPAAVWPRRRVAVLMGAAAASVFAAGAAAAVAGGVFHSTPGARPGIHAAAGSPATTRATTPLTSTTGGDRVKQPPVAPVSTAPAAPAAPAVVPAPQVIRISLPAPLPAAAAALVRDVILHPPVVAPPVVKPPPVMQPPPVVKPPVVTPPPVVPPEDIKSDRREHCEDEQPGKGHDHERDGDHEHNICR